MSVAADDCFARSDVAEMTIALATSRSRRAWEPGYRSAMKGIEGG